MNKTMLNKRKRTYKGLVTLLIWTTYVVAMVLICKMCIMSFSPDVCEVVIPMTGTVLILAAGVINLVYGRIG